MEDLWFIEQVDVDWDLLSCEMEPFGHFAKHA